MSDIYFSVSDTEIARLCRYITSDKDVASYFTIPEARVARVRKNNPPPRAIRPVRPILPTEDCRRRQDQKTALSSKDLRDRLWTVYTRVGKERGISASEACAQLLAGRGAS